MNGNTTATGHKSGRLQTTQQNYKNDMAFYRRPSPIELTYIAADTPTYSPYVNQFFAEGEGDLDLASLQQAVAKVAEFFVEIRMVLKGYLKWRYWDDAGTPPRVYAMDAGRWDGMTNIDVPVVGSPMNVRSGPVCEVILLEGTPKRILFRTHHACTDGAGTRYLMDSVFSVLRGETPTPPNCRYTEWDVVKQQGHQEKQTKLGNSKPVFRNLAATLDVGCLWHRIHYTGSPSGLNGKILSVLADMANAQGDERFVVRIPADLRRYLPKGEFTGSNCSSALDLDIGQERSPKKIQQAIIGAMRTKQDIALLHPNAGFLQYFPLRMLKTPEKLRKQIYTDNRFPYSAIVTNMGEIPMATFSAPPRFQAHSAFGVNIALPLAPFSISFFHCETGVWMSIGIPRAVGTQEDLARLCDEFTRRLQAMDKTSKNDK